MKRTLCTLSVLFQIWGFQPYDPDLASSYPVYVPVIGGGYYGGFGYGPLTGYVIPGTFYYCQDPPGYYPAVSSCANWRAAPPPPCLEPLGSPVYTQCLPHPNLPKTKEPR